MKIIRCLVMDCVVYTQFVNSKVVRDEYETHEKALHEQQMLLFFSRILHGQDQVA